MHTSCNFLSAILYHPSLSAFSIYHPDSGWHVTSSDQGLSFPEERAWERGWIPGRSHGSFMDIESNPLHSLDEDKFGAWLKRHQRNISLHFPTAELESMDEDIEEEFDEEF